ncbi:MAG: S1 RNA-binding domain-containing protein [Sandaracinus sp.]|nr:S1 RNA-binding domain-containing protein [Sandaracinus sp.]
MSDQQKSPSFADMFEASGGTAPTRRRYRVGEAVKGQVVLVGAEGVFIELEGQQGFFPKLALSPTGKVEVAVGDELDGFVTKIEGGAIELGRRLGGMGMSREQLETALAEKAPVEGKVTGVVKGGLTVDLGGTRAFCPMGMVDTRRVMDATPYLLQTLQFQVVELRGDRDVIVSRRAILEAEQAVQREALLQTMQLGARVFAARSRRSSTSVRSWTSAASRASSRPASSRTTVAAPSRSSRSATTSRCASSTSPAARRRRSRSRSRRSPPTRGTASRSSRPAAASSRARS